MNDQWHIEQALFHEVCNLPPEQQSAFLAKLPKAQRDKLSQLLTHDKSPASSLLDSVEEEALSLLVPMREQIGPYKILERIGTGGMGSVYKAQRAIDFQQLVAIKLVPTVFERPELLERFRIERQILADLDHPNIARLLDGGKTEDGMPYLVMEYVDGVPIDEYCRKNKLGKRARLALFLDVCSAVQYAHQNLIIHRDIKPDNILVTEDGVIKLLDFGVAKLIEPHAQHTRTADVMMTPSYASPEQVKHETLTTASDVYALGVSLYQLITGVLPFELKDLSRGEAEQKICNELPALPSTLNAASKGDIDAMIMMALRKEPERRYATVNELSADIRRYLRGYPVRAAPDSLGYRTGKFLRRNSARLFGGFVASLVLLTALGLVISGRQAVLTAKVIAEQKTEAAQQAAQFLGAIFSQASPFRHGGTVSSVPDLLESAVGDIDQAFSAEPVLQAMLYAELAVSMAELSMTDSAQRTAQLALAALERTAGAPEDYLYVWVQTLIRLTALPFAITDFAHAMELIGTARETALAQASPDPLLIARIELRQSRLEYEWDRPDGGLAAVERALAYEQLDVDAPALYAEALSHKGKIIAARHKEVETGLALMHQALEIKAAALGELHPSILWELDNYVTHVDRTPQNVAEIRRVADYQQRIIDHNFGGGGVWVVFPLWTRGAAAAANGDWAEAEASFDQFVSIGLEHGYSGMFLVYSSRDSGWAALKQRKYEKAEREFGRMLDYAVDAFGTSHWAIHDAHLYLSAVKQLQGDGPASYEYLYASLANREKAFDSSEREAPEFEYLRLDQQAVAIIAEHNDRFKTAEIPEG